MIGAEYSNLARRDFLRVGSLSLLGIHLRQYLMAAVEGAARKGKAQACVMLWLEGGPSQVDTWDPKSNSAFKPISTNVPGIQISELLPKVARHMDKLAIIRSMHTEENNHPQATHYAVTGHRPNPAMQFPSLGSIIAKETGPRNSLPPYVVTAELDLHQHFRSHYLGPEVDPMVTANPGSKDFSVPDLSLPKSVSVEQLQDRRAALALVDRLYRQKIREAEYGKMDNFTETAWKMILSPNVRDAFDLSKEPDKVKDAYGRHPFGQSVLLARRLVESGTRFVTAAGYKTIEWDTHGDNNKRHRESLCPSFDQAFSTFLTELEERGLLESTVVIAMGEFGRTPHINPKAGRDHWPHCWSLVLGGGGIRGGQVIGASDARGGYVADRQVTMGDVFAT
ncbi:MAG: DUF1501 domain-containing protein, partial [Acidobacteria bacterium]|nr:DUF1501 domain-containing protein [Acidobacteriota bacterium]